MAITEIIKYEGDNTTFVWKHPCEDFNTLTQLIVHESQEVVFFLNGQALDLFGPGRHTLETQNIPLVKKFLNLPTGGETPFHAEVYYINKTEQMAIKWGTDSKLQYMEPTYNFPIQIGASGEMSLRAEDSRKLLIKLVGTEKTLTQNGLTVILRAFLLTRVKSYLAKTIKDLKINIFEIDEHLNQLSDDLHAKLVKDFIQYGVALERFFVTTIVKPDGDASYEKFKLLHFRKYADITDAEIRQQVGVIEQQTKAKQTVIEAEGLARKRQLEGFTYQQERGFEVAEQVARNEGAGNFSSAGIGLGMITGIGGTVGGAVSNAVNNALEPIVQPPSDSKNIPAVSAFCEHCGSPLAKGAQFCEECGEKVSQKSCLNCGFVFEKPGKFCPKCGTKR